MCLVVGQFILSIGTYNLHVCSKAFKLLILTFFDEYNIGV